MKKKVLFPMLLIVLCVAFAGCGSKYVKAPEQYGQWESYLNVPDFLPSSIEYYEVNGYSYTLLAYMDVCYEIFVDITVSEEQFDELIAAAKAHSDYEEKAAYYCDGYTEIVFKDYYQRRKQSDNSPNRVKWADIEKVVYNPETRNIVYECFHANDTYVYHLDEVEYFNRFSIKEHEYIASFGIDEPCD